MPRYSVIYDNKIINSIFADSLEDAIMLTSRECKEENQEFPFGIGYVYNGSEWVFPGMEENNNA
jgi:hypothetical protein